ncbi:hypothetical protein AB0K21_29660 [Streptosporangium sp. NPDC049248]|uniref:amidohydrolase family protein n=1 Tax=Streptosporangium sp. NPDC049248 TaxID=3155651 RepID=UPI00342EC85A
MTGRRLQPREGLFGTNWPRLPHDRALAQVEQLGLSDDARADFLGGAARRVFRLSGGPAAPVAGG